MVHELSTPPGSGVRPAPRDPELAERARRLLGDDRVRRAVDYVRESDGRTLDDQRELTEIAAPPFGEHARGVRMAELMDEAGLEGVTSDQEGNVLGRLPGREEDAPLTLSAHLDTVFPPGTDVRVREEEDRLVGPGISDDGRGLAVLLALARTVRESGIELERPLLFAATVGEEGAGDLRGVRHLFRDDGPASDVRGFVSLDGAGLSRIVTVGLGSRRYRLTVEGPGGHSWVNWGTANPIHALGRLVSDLADLDLSEEPRSTLTVARWSGGTSVNAIPQEAWLELEVRSEGTDPLEALDREIRKLAETVVARANRDAREGTDPLRLTLEVIGDRPFGATDPDTSLVRAAAEATRALGEEPELAVSSTDANVAMTLGIPALTMGAGGEAGQAHTTDEWYRNTDGPEGILRALLTVLLLDPG